MKKRLFAMVLVVCLLLSLVPVPAFAEEDTAVMTVQTLIDALPDTVTAENRQTVEDQLDAIDKARLPLTVGEQEKLDFAKYDAAIAAINALDDQPGAEVPDTDDNGGADEKGSWGDVDLEINMGRNNKLIFDQSLLQGTEFPFDIGLFECILNADGMPEDLTVTFDGLVMNISADTIPDDEDTREFSYTLESENYEDITITVTLTFTSKVEQKDSITVDWIEEEFGSYPDYAPPIGRYFNLTVAYFQGNTELDEIPNTPGNYTVTVSWEDDENIYSGSAEFSILSAGYTITLDPNGGTVPSATVTTDANGKLASLPKPSREGYTFGGWYTASTGGEVCNADKVYTENTTLYARWLKVITEVDFSLSGYGYEKDITGITVTSDAGITFEAKYGEDYGITDDDVSGGDGYLEPIYDGTFTTGKTYYLYVRFEAASGFAFADSLGTPGTVTLFGQNPYVSQVDAGKITSIFKLPVMYSVTFDPNGGEMKEAEKTAIATGGELATLPTPTRDGYLFDGWYTEKDGGEKVGTDKQYSANTTLCAHWTANTYTLTFDTKGGTEVESITQTYGTAVTAPAIPTREGYTFAGWEPEVPETMPAENMTLTAKWTANTYTLTFDTKGGSEVKSITQTQGTAVTAPKEPTREGYTFAGWEPEVPETMPAENMTLIAKWTANTYTLTFDTKGGSEVKSITQTQGTAVTAPKDPTREGYTFAGWEPEVPETMPAKDMTLTAKWTANTYTLTFDTEGGSEVKPLIQAYGTTVAAPDAPTKKGHTFAGWEPEMPGTMPARNMTLTARWTANSYTIHLDANGGTGTMKDLTVTYGQIQTLNANAYTLSGYKFHGWNTRPDGTGTAYEDKQMVQNLTEEDKKGITLYAQWDKILERVDMTLSGHVFDKSVEQVKVTSQDGIAFRDTTYDGSWGITKDPRKLNTLSGKLFQADTQYYLWVKFSAKAGYTLEELTAKNVCLDGTAALSLTQKEGTVTAVFRLPVIYTIKITVGKNGSVDADDVLRVFEGENVTIKINPDSGYVVYRLEIDGANVTTTRTYTFQNVQESHTLKVRFLKNGSNAKTGDSFPLVPAVSVLALSAVALAAIFVIAKEKKRK